MQTVEHHLKESSCFIYFCQHCHRKVDLNTSGRWRGILHLFGCNCECFLLTGGGFQRVRTHLYGSLLYYLQIAQRPDEPDTLEAGMVQVCLKKSKK